MRILLPLAIFFWAGAAIGEVTEVPYGAWSFEHELMLPGTPEEIYDASTGDILPWWDHHMAEHPKALYIEPWPGGSFLEVFDDSGDGAQHARVIHAERGKMLRMRGPLGLAGNALDMVFTLTYTAEGESTRVHLTVDAAGHTEEGWADAVDRVWHHFLVEQLKSYVESGAHRDKTPLSRPPIRTGRLEVTDADGHVVAWLGVDEGGSAGLFLQDDDGATRASVTHDGEQSALYLYDDAGTVRVGVAQFAHGGGGVALHGPESKGGAVLYLKDAGSLTFYDAEGKVLDRLPSK